MLKRTNPLAKIGPPNPQHLERAARSVRRRALKNSPLHKQRAMAFKAMSGSRTRRLTRRSARTWPTANSMIKQSESTELVSVDDAIDAIAREALEEARRVEEAERYRKNPGPVVPPNPATNTPK